MIEAIGPRTLWAMEPTALAAMLSRIRVEGLMPDGIKGLASLAAGGALTAAAEARTGDPIREGATAIIPVQGPLSPKGQRVYMGGGTVGTVGSTRQLDEQMRTLAADSSIGAIILDIASPGGLVMGTPEAADAIFAARQVKPVIAVANHYSFSAAHWLATQASAYFVSPSGEVGSVGVRGGHVDMSGFEEKIGMKTTLIASDPEKIAGNPYAPLSEADRADMQTQIDAINADFARAIARGRGISPSAVADIHGRGRTFLASAALQAGTVDGIMTLRDVIGKYSSSRSRLDLMRRRAEVQRQIADI